MIACRPVRVHLDRHVAHARRAAAAMMAALVATGACADGASATSASPAVVPADWYEVVAPYRYEAARRFEAGWRRGVTARPGDGRVRALQSGVVRWVGMVAGRGVVTVRVPGTARGSSGTIYTYVGVEPGTWRPGARIRRGAAIGGLSGGDRRTVHLGRYDERVRWRYLPLVAGVRRALPVRGTDGGRPTGRVARRGGLGGSVVSRLIALVDGAGRAAWAPGGPGGRAGVEEASPNRASAWGAPVGQHRRGVAARVGDEPQARGATAARHHAELSARGRIEKRYARGRDAALRFGVDQVVQHLRVVGAERMPSGARRDPIEGDVSGLSARDAGAAAASRRQSRTDSHSANGAHVGNATSSRGAGRATTSSRGAGRAESGGGPVCDTVCVAIRATSLPAHDAAVRRAILESVAPLAGRSSGGRAIGPTASSTVPDAWSGAVGMPGAPAGKRIGRLPTDVPAVNGSPTGGIAAAGDGAGPPRGPGELNDRGPAHGRDPVEGGQVHLPLVSMLVAVVACLLGCALVVRRATCRARLLPGRRRPVAVAVRPAAAALPEMADEAIEGRVLGDVRVRVHEHVGRAGYATGPDSRATGRSA